MLLIELNNGKILEWHVGEPKPVYKDPPTEDEIAKIMKLFSFDRQKAVNTLNLDVKNKYRAIAVTADGHELQYVLEYFNNIPYSTRCRVQTWNGDFAQFIYNNLV